MPLSASRWDEATIHGEDRWEDDGWVDDSAWVQVPEIRPLPGPRPRRRTRFGAVWALALLGVALALAAALWYSRLDRGAPSTPTVPRVVGLQESPAIHRLRTLGLAVRAVEVPRHGRKGVVFGQSPATGTTLARGDTVTIAVAG